jgi:hypothetical protein
MSHFDGTDEDAKNEEGEVEDAFADSHLDGHRGEPECYTSESTQ